jgi:hypothetical protein
MNFIRPACRSCLFIIAITVGTLGCGGGTGTSAGSGGGDGNGGGGGGNNPPPSVQLWSGILHPSRATDWTKAGVQGGIPTYTNICQTVTPSGDTSGALDAQAINAALSTCAGQASPSSPQVVLLAAGTFHSNASIGPPAGAKYLVIRGAGPDKTTIKWVGTSAACGSSGGVDLCFEGNGNDNSSLAGTHSWLGTTHSVGTYTQGASILDLDSTDNISAGMIVVLTQRDDGMGLCPQSGGVGNCSGQVGLTDNGNGTVTAVTSAPYSSIVNGSLVYIGPGNQNYAYAACGNYQSGLTPVTASSVTTTATNTTFTYTPNFSPLSAPTSSCNPVYVAVDTGGVFTCNINGGCNLGGATAGTQCTSTSSAVCQPGEYSWRSQSEAHLVTAVCKGAGAPIAQCLAANEIVIDGQVIMPNYRSSQAPGVWWTASGANQFSQYVGVESLTMDTTNDGGPQSSLKFFNAANFWVKNIRSINPADFALFASNVTRGAIVDSYFFGAQHTGPNSYAIDLANDTTYVLVQNNILQHILVGLQTEQSSGSVYGYNYLVDENNPITNSFLSMFSLNHGFSAAMLAEGNNSPGCHTDNIHGTSWAATFFRNRCRGQDTPERLSNSTLVALQDNSFNRAENLVGNVFGTVGYQSTYVANAPLPPFPAETIYWLDVGGYLEAGYTGPRIGSDDPLVTSTLLRWGNYDVVTGDTRWCGTGSEANCSGISEIPTTGAAYINGNPVPASHSLPPSFYLSRQPAWWTTPFGTPKWPAIGPDVTGTAPDGLNGMADSIPAQLCVNNTPIDPSYQRAFAITNATWASIEGGQATFIAGNTLAPGNTVTVIGAIPSNWNGTWQVSAATATTVTVSMSNNPGAYQNGGTINYPNILHFNAKQCYPGAY